MLSGSTLLIQMVGLALAPVYARLYAPHDYGVFGQFYSIVNALLILSCFCYELAIPNAKDTEEALALVVLSASCVGFVALLSLGWALLVVWQSRSNPAASNQIYFLLVPLAVLLSGLYRIVQYWALRVQALKMIASTLVKQMAGGQAINLGLGILHPNPLGLILGQIVSSCAGVTSLARAGELARLLRTHRSAFSPQRLWQVAKKHRQYALVQCPSTLLNSAGLYLPGMLMLPYFGADFAGQFNMAQRVGRIPVNLLGSSAGQVFFSEAASVARTEPQRLRPLFNSISRKLALAGLLVLAACLLAPLAMSIVFGKRWSTAGELTLWMGFGLALQLWVSPLSNIPNVVGRLKGQLAIDAARAALVFLALFLPSRFAWGGKVAVISYSAVLVANYAACYVLYRHQVLVQSQNSLRATGLEQGAPA
jgi:O-antigen/teichoic acid export membrane protein